MNNNQNNIDYDQIEEDLKKKELQSQKIPMPVSGRGIFRLKHIIETKKEKGKSPLN